MTMRAVRAERDEQTMMKGEGIRYERGTREFGEEGDNYQNTERINWIVVRQLD